MRNCIGNTNLRFVLPILLVALTLSSSIAADTDWEIEPVADPRLTAGKLSVVGGELDGEPVHFVVKNLSLTQPIEVLLVATAAAPLEISVYKDIPEHALASDKATKGTPADLHFRTGDSVYLEVRGERGAHYQLLTWVGPEIEIEDPPPVIAVSEYPASPPRVERSSAGATRTNAAPDSAPAGKPTSAGALVLGFWPALLLGLILLALITIICLLWRRGGRTAVGIVLCVLVTGAASAASVPKKISAEDEAAEVKGRVDRLKQFGDVVDKIKKADASSTDGLVPKPTKTETATEYAKDDYRKGLWNPVKVTRDSTDKSKGEIDYAKALKNLAAATKFVLAFYETYGLIDPREAAIQKNMNPPGMPLLPSRCAKDERCRACFKKATADLEEARSLLEEQYVIYKQMEVAAGRIIELADGAASMSGIAKFVWDQQKNSEAMTKQRDEFYGKYDANLAKLLANLNNALIAQGSCERDVFGDQDWYNRYGWIYYTFMRDRYTRK